MGYTSLSRHTKDALATCHPYGKHSFSNAEDVTRFWEARGRVTTAFLNLKELTPSMVREIRLLILEPYDQANPRK